MSKETNKTRAQEILDLDINQDELKEFFIGIVSGDYCDGSSYQLYLDMDNASLICCVEASSSSWRQRDDGSLILVDKFSSPQCDDEEPYEDGFDLNDYGWQEWRQAVETRIAEALDELEEEEA